MAALHTSPKNNAVTYRNQFGDGSVLNGSIWVNGLKPLSRNTELYFFGGFNSRFSDAYAWTRTATTGIDNMDDTTVALHPEVPNERSNAVLYPNGFDPKIQAKIRDVSVSLGLKHQYKAWVFDLNNTFGRNSF
ncbi:MAG: hypothetical protein ACKO1F_10295, partial [Flammeovirgaceae bacterium]